VPNSPMEQHGTKAMPTLPQRLRAATGRFKGQPPGLGPPGPNALFFAVCAAVLLGLLAGVFAGGQDEIARSNLVYRLVVGSIVFAVVYAVVVILWLAWHRRALKKLNVGPAGGETPDQSTGAEIAGRDEEIKEFMETTTNAIENLDERLSRLEP
jgi:hypothetical protein